MKLQEIGRLLGLEVEGDADLEISGLAGIEDAGPTELSFVSSPQYTRALARSGAGAVIAPAGMDVAKRSCLRSTHPYRDFGRAIPLFHPRTRPAPGIHATAVIAPDAELGADVSIGPYAVIGERVRIGTGTSIGPHTVIYPNVTIGASCEIHSGVHVREGVEIGARVVLHNGAVIGSEGFGFAFMPDGSKIRIPHSCGVRIEDDVEVGANSTIDASHPGHARHGDTYPGTRIERGVKIDNQVQVGHGCVVGENTALCAQVGLAGSTIVGRNVYMAGQAGAKGHVHIGDGSIVGGATGVVRDVPPGAQILGVPPGVDRRLWGRIVAAWKRLPDLITRVRELERRLDERLPEESKPSED